MPFNSPPRTLEIQGFETRDGNRGLNPGYRNLLVMRYRNRTNSLLEKLDGRLQGLKRIVNRQEPIDTYINAIENAQSIVDELKSIIEAEPIAPNERSR